MFALLNGHWNTRRSDVYVENIFSFDVAIGVFVKEDQISKAIGFARRLCDGPWIERSAVEHIQIS